MKENWEYQIFNKEIKRLQRDYHRCDNQSVKREIYKDIKLLKQAIINLKSN
jgi:hypothetical protein